MLAASGFVASREWFSGDDFAFLALVQRPDVWSWRDAYLPLGERFWPFYRPLGMQTYFRLAVAAFGLSAPAFFAVSLAVHFTRGLVVFRLARQLDCDTPRCGGRRPARRRGRGLARRDLSGDDLPLRGGEPRIGAVRRVVPERAAGRRKRWRAGAPGSRSSLRCCATSPPSCSRRCSSQWRCTQQASR